MLNKIHNLMQYQIDGRIFAEILFDWNCKIDDVIDYYPSITQILNDHEVVIHLETPDNVYEEGYTSYVIKISDKTQSIYIRLEGVYCSYDNTFKNWHQVKPVEVTKIEYQRC